MTKTITISESVWKKLARFKIHLNLKTYSEVLERLFNLVTKFKLAKELEDVK